MPETYDPTHARSRRALRVGRTLALTAILVVITGAVASSEVAARQPTPAQTRGLLAALPKFIRSVLRKCIRFDMSVSANKRYARVSPVFLNATHLHCVKYASNGFGS
jgi:hypothetical protein